MPGRQPMGGGGYQPPQGGQPDYYRQAYGNAGPALNSQVESMRHMLSNPNQPPAPGVPGGWQQQQHGRNTGVSGGQNYGQPQQESVVPSGLHEAFQQSSANGFTDIQGTDRWKTGDFMGQLEGFNTKGGAVGNEAQAR